MAPRLPDWRPRLDRVVSLANRQPWRWGEHDCLAFAARDIEALTGEDLFAPYRGQYDDEAGANRIAPDVGEFMHELAERQGWPRIKAVQAREGDLALFDRGLPIVGVVYTRLIFPNKPAGLRSLPCSAASIVWAVGYG